jgi:hypothetical protein
MVFFNLGSTGVRTVKMHPSAREAKQYAENSISSKEEEGFSEQVLIVNDLTAGARLLSSEEETR